MGVVTAERIKLTSTRSPWWCAAVIALLGIGLPVLNAGIIRAAKNSPDSGDLQSLVVPGPELAVSGLLGIGTSVLMIMAALTVTNEYRFGVIRTTYQATPNRTLVLLAKAVVNGVVGLALALAIGFIAFLGCKAILGSTVVLEFSATTWRILLGGGYYAVLCIILAVAVGALVRQSAAAIALLILWPVMERLVALFGKAGREISGFLPFNNAAHFFGDTAADASSFVTQWHWGPWGGITFFTAFVALVFAAALVSVNRRDA